MLSWLLVFTLWTHSEGLVRTNYEVSSEKVCWQIGHQLLNKAKQLDQDNVVMASASCRKMPNHVIEPFKADKL